MSLMEKGRGDAIAHEIAAVRSLSSPGHANATPNTPRGAARDTPIDPSDSQDFGGEYMDSQESLESDEFYSAKSGSESSTSHGSLNFQNLPSELIASILEYLSPQELAMVRQVSKAICFHADSEFHWQRHVLSNLPGNPITSPYPFETFRELYACHEPFWFIPQNKLWFSDRGMSGQMIIAQYDQRRGVIEGYELVAIDTRGGSEPWVTHDDMVVQVELFEPEIKLHRDKPVLKLNSADRQPRGEPGSSSSSPRQEFFPAQPMSLDIGTDPRVGEVALAKPLSGVLEAHVPQTFPYGYVWPPPTIPASHRVGAQAAGVLPISNQRLEVASPGNWAPSSRSQASDQTFRIRRWMEWARSGLGLKLGEETITWSTIDPYYYTPTKEKPWRGIWVGDYNLHGCEFLLIHQPDSADDDSETLQREQGETDDDFEKRFLQEKVYKGSIRAIKLTGDTNVPRGEISFVAPELGEAGLVAVEKGPPFEGCRIVKSRGHIANDGFVNDTYMESQLILVSHNRLAQYWINFRHVSYYQRVDIDRFLVP